MASPDDIATTSSYEPARRQGHVLFSHNSLTYLVGGQKVAEHIDLAYVDVFNPLTLKWQRQQTTGDTPAQLSFTAHAKVGTSVYFFGGGGFKSQNNNTMTILDLESLRWKNLQPQHVPSPRAGAGMISDGDRLYLHGGRDDRHNALSDLHIFSISDGECRETALLWETRR